MKRYASGYGASVGSLSIPSAGRQPMKRQAVVWPVQEHEPFNTLCGSSANEAERRAISTLRPAPLSIPSAGRQPMKLGTMCNFGCQCKPFNTLCGSSANEAAWLAAHAAQILAFNTLCGSSANEAGEPGVIVVSP